MLEAKTFNLAKLRCAKLALLGGQHPLKLQKNSTQGPKLQYAYICLKMFKVFSILPVNDEKHTIGFFIPILIPTQTASIPILPDLTWPYNNQPSGTWKPECGTVRRAGAEGCETGTVERGASGAASAIGGQAWISKRGSRVDVFRSKNPRHLFLRPLLMFLFFFWCF